MIPDLPSPLLRSFLAVVDGGALATAARRIGRSESALSLQMTRLADIVGQPLFDRDGRSLKLNQTGGQLLPHARAIVARIDSARSQLSHISAKPIRIGIVQDFVDAILQPTLVEFRDEATEIAITVVIGSTAELLYALSENRIDTALYAGEAAGSAVTRRLPMHWFGDPALATADVIPLVAITPPCPFLKAAQDALDLIGRPWRLALVTPSLDGLRAATRAGLGLTCRTEAGLAMRPLTDTNLPRLPKIAYSVSEHGRNASAVGEATEKLQRHLMNLTLSP